MTKFGEGFLFCTFFCSFEVSLSRASGNFTKSLGSDTCRLLLPPDQICLCVRASVFWSTRMHRSFAHASRHRTSLFFLLGRGGLMRLLH